MRRARRRSVSLPLLGAALLVILGGIPASTAPPRISPSSGVLTWKGATLDGAVADPSLCTPDACDTYTFTVEKPRGYWTERWGGVEISIRWPSEYDDFDLYVYRGSDLYTRSVGSFSEAEGVLLHRPRAATYRVVVVPVSVSESSYRGLLQWELRPKPEGRKLRFPNLVTLRPHGFRIVAPVFYATGETVPYGEGTFSCYFDEVAENPGLERCLRFSNGIANVGAGRLTLRMNLSDAGSERTMYQVVRRRDGTAIMRDAGTYEIHPTHAHFHYEGFADYRLYSVDPVTGERTDSVSRGRKSGFCLIDVRLVWWAKIGNERRHFSFPDCDIPKGGDGTYLMGMSKGWADIYTWDLPDQYLDITGVPDGIYEVASEADIAGALRETDEVDNARSVFVKITGDEVKVVPPPGRR